MRDHRAGRNWLLWSSAAAVALLSLGTATGRALAQDGGPTVLEDVVIEGGNGEGTGEDGGTGPVPGYVAKQTKTGSKTATPIQEVPQAVSVIGRDEIEDQGAQKTDEALRYTAGVTAQPFGPDLDTNWFFIRGFNATQNGTFMDGLQLNSYGFGGFFIDSFLLERIEVLKGPASVLYGGANSGGIVNYVSKRPTEDAFTRIEAGIDSFGTGYVGFDVDGGSGSPIISKDGQSSGPASALDYRVTGRIYGGDGYTDFSEQLLGTISPSLTWTPDAATSLTVLANYTHLDLTHNGGGFLPYEGTVVDAPFGRIDREFNATEPDLDDYDRQQASIGYEFSHEFDNSLTFRQNARYGYAEVSEYNLFPFFYTNPGAGDYRLNRLQFAQDTTVNNFLLDNQLEGKFDTGAVNHTLLAGINYNFFNVDEASAFPGGTPIDPENPDYGTPQPAFTLGDGNEFNQNQLGVYVQDQLRFGGGWLVTLNGRYDQVWADLDDRTAADQDRDKSFGEGSGRAGIAYEFANGVTPYASVSTFFLPLLGTNFATGDLLEPETGEQYEVGLKYVPTTFDGVFTVSLFDLTRQNYAVTEPGSTGSTQIQEVRSKGIEFEGKTNLTANLDAVAALTFQDVEITETADGGFVGNKLFRIPDSQAALFLNYTFHKGALDGFSVGGGVRYVGQSYADNDNDFEVPDFTLADARIGYKKDNWGVDLTVTNLFDKKYVSVCQGTGFCYYGESRKALLKANFEW